VTRAAQPAEDLARRYREEFDRGFARPRERAETALDDYLALRVGGDPFVLRLVEIESVHANRVIVPLPSSAPELLGIAGLRNTLVSVYDLRALLGYPPGPAPRWFALARGAQPVGLAFEQFEGHVRLPRERRVASATPSARRHTTGVVDTGELRPVLDTGSLLAALPRRGG
jgi:chemotaxis signal transduction protein